MICGLLAPSFIQTAKVRQWSNLLIQQAIGKTNKNHFLCLGLSHRPFVHMVFQTCAPPIPKIHEESEWIPWAMNEPIFLRNWSID